MGPILLLGRAVGFGDRSDTMNLLLVRPPAQSVTNCTNRLLSLIHWLVIIHREVSRSVSVIMADLQYYPPVYSHSYHLLFIEFPLGTCHYLPLF